MGRSVAIRVLIADDDPIVRELLCRVLAHPSGVEVVGEALDGPETLERLDQLRPDVLLLDNLMPMMEGLEVLRRIAQGNVRVGVILVAAHMSKQQTLEALQLGARGILVKKSIRRLLDCLACVAEGGYWAEEQSFATLADAVAYLIARPERTVVADERHLTTRELQLISLVAIGQTNRQIGATLSIREDTVKRHLANIFRKCGVSNRVELVLFASRYELLASTSPRTMPPGR